MLITLKSGLNTFFLAYCPQIVILTLVFFLIFVIKTVYSAGFLCFLVSLHAKGYSLRVNAKKSNSHIIQFFHQYALYMIAQTYDACNKAAVKVDFISP